MFPVLVSVGPITVYTVNIFYIISWCVFSFLFWRYLRHHGMLEERIFDLTFYATLGSILGARLGFVFLYPQLFSASILLVGAFWVQPGVWIQAGIFSLFLVFYLYSKRIRTNVAQVFDAGILALPWTLFLIMIGEFLHGGEIGKPTTSFLGVRFPGDDVVRHPVHLYESSVLLIVGIVFFVTMNRALQDKWPHGLIGSLLLVVLTPLLFIVEFFKMSPVYLYGITITQWMYVAVFAQSFGIVFTKGGIYERIVYTISRRGSKKSSGGAGADQATNERVETSGSVSGSGSRE